MYATIVGRSHSSGSQSTLVTTFGIYCSIDVIAAKKVGWLQLFFLQVHLLIVSKQFPSLFVYRKIIYCFIFFFPSLLFLVCLSYYHHYYSLFNHAPTISFLHSLYIPFFSLYVCFSPSNYRLLRVQYPLKLFYTHHSFIYLFKFLFNHSNCIYIGALFFSQKKKISGPPNNFQFIISCLYKYFNNIDKHSLSQSILIDDAYIFLLFMRW